MIGSDDVKKRYLRSLDTVSEEELKLLQKKSVGVVGCGGLGGYVIEMLARFGIGKIRIIDGDVFDESNLNRQLLSSEENLGLPKVEQAARRIKEINPDVAVDMQYALFDEASGPGFVKGLDLLIDCVDNVQARLLMEELATKEGIVLCHGAVGAWIGQVITVYPGDYILKDIYNDGKINLPLIGAASFIPATVASYQVAEAIKVLTHKGETLRKQMMYFDLLENNNFILDLTSEESD